MASKGRMVWYNDAYRAVTLDEAHYLTLTDPGGLLDFATYDFALEILFLPDSTVGNPTEEKVIISKSPGWLGASEAGWMVVWYPDTDSLKVYFNDGNATILWKTYTGVVTDDAWNFFRLEFDRDSTLHLYKNGALVDNTFDLTGRPNSIDNDADIYVGDCPAAGGNNNFKGWIGLLRIDGGPGWFVDPYGQGHFSGDRDVAYGAAWNLENYYRLKYGHPRQIDHYIAAWYFLESLVDESYGELAFAWNGGGSASYGQGWPYIYDYTFEFNPYAEAGLEIGHVDLDGRLRALDGSMKTYKGGRKRRCLMLIRTTSAEQLLAIQGAFCSGVQVSVYEYGDRPAMFTGYFVVPPWPIEVGRDSLTTVWEIEVELEEM